MKHKVVYIILFCTIHHLSAFCQMCKEVSILPEISWNEKELVADLSRDEKVKLLSMLPEGDSVQFEDPSYDPDYSTGSKYLWLDTAGLRYLD